MKARALVVGGAGFIGSHLVDRLVHSHEVTVLDDLSVGSRERIAGPLDSGRARLVVADARDAELVSEVMAGHELVVHLCANPEARVGLLDTRRDLELGTLTTHAVLEAARRTGAERFVFSSSGTVYGDRPDPVAEQDLGRLPISLYGASKLACEAMISAFSECFGLRATVLRFGNVVGPRGTHGAALDFLKQLRPGAEELVVLGDGQQAKPYLHVEECVAGMLFAAERQRERFDVFNLAPRDTCSVETIARLCVAASPAKGARIRFTGGDRGWLGDVPRSRMNASKLAALGFELALSSEQAVERAVGALACELWGRELPR